MTDVRCPRCGTACPTCAAAPAGYDTIAWRPDVRDLASVRDAYLDLRPAADDGPHRVRRLGPREDDVDTFGPPAPRSVTADDSARRRISPVRRPQRRTED